jgi:hypothetical protein
MYFRLSLLLVAAVALATASPTGKILNFRDAQFDKKEILSKFMQEFLLPKLLSELKQSLPPQGTPIHNLVDTIKVADPAHLGGFNVSLEWGQGGSQRSYGYASAQNVELHGSSQIADTFTTSYDMVMQRLTTTWKIGSSGPLRFEGNYDLQQRYEVDFCIWNSCGTITIPSSGLGGWFLELVAPSLELTVVWSVPLTGHGHVGVVSYAGLINLDSAAITFENFEAVDTPFGPEDWVYVGQMIKDLVTYTNENSGYFNQQIGCLMDNIVNGCTIIDMITLNWACLKMEIQYCDQ